MSYSSSMLRFLVDIYNRTEQTAGKFGIDGSGISWEKVAENIHVNITWAKGATALRVGAIDAYTEIIVRMPYNTVVNMRSRIMWNGQLYQIKPNTFHPDYMEDKIQFNATLLVDEVEDEETTTTDSGETTVTQEETLTV